MCLGHLNRAQEEGPPCGDAPVWVPSEKRAFISIWKLSYVLELNSPENITFGEWELIFKISSPRIFNLRGNCSSFILDNIGLKRTVSSLCERIRGVSE